MKNRAETSRKVRYNDGNGLKCDLNKIHFPNESRRDAFYCATKFYEGDRKKERLSPTSVATKNKKLWKYLKVADGLVLDTWPEDFESFTHEKKKNELLRLVNNLEGVIVAAMTRGPNEGVEMMADPSDNRQVGESSALKLDTSRENVDLQVNNPVQSRVEEVRDATPNPDSVNASSNDASSQNVTGNQLDDSQGVADDSLPPVSIELIALVARNLKSRAAKFLGKLQDLPFDEEKCTLWIISLQSLEGALEDNSNTCLRSRQEEILEPLECP